MHSQVRVTREEDTIHVPYFSLVPVGPVKQASNGRDGRDFVCIGFDADSGLMSDREEVVDDLLKSSISDTCLLGHRRTSQGPMKTHLKAVRAGWEIYRRNVHDRLVLALSMIP